ncbi:MAG: hypothetical protein WCX73_00365 [Candidatus Pacearchaeota archaeon]|jgi:hypothetical protein
MGLREIKIESYCAKQINVCKAEQEVHNSIKEYSVLLRGNGIPNKDQTFTYTNNLFQIPSINGYLEISTHWDTLENQTVRKLFSKTEIQKWDKTFSDPTKFISEINVMFQYLEGTQQEDLNVIRKAIKGAGLEQITEAPR